MKLLRDTWLIFVRNAVATLREPVWVMVGLFQPVCFLVLFASLLNTIVLPMTLLSGIYLPLTLAPGWLQIVGDINPLAYAVDAARALMNGHLGDAAVLQGFAVLAPLALLAPWWAARAFRKAIA